MLCEDGPNLLQDYVNGIQYTLQTKNIVRAFHSSHVTFFLIQLYSDLCGEQVRVCGFNEK